MDRIRLVLRYDRAYSRSKVAGAESSAALRDLFSGMDTMPEAAASWISRRGAYETDAYYNRSVANWHESRSS